MAATPMEPLSCPKPARVVTLTSEMSASVDYHGPERRRHNVFVTRNSEYHFRDERCVAVRDRLSRQWLPAHLALQRNLSGTVRFDDEGPKIGNRRPSVGDALWFADDGRELVTSVLCSVERPPKNVVETYARGGEIPIRDRFNQ